VVTNAREVEFMDTTETKWIGAGAVLAAVGASLCCVLPVVVAFAGIGSAAVGALFEPFRPYFSVVTVLLLGFAFFRAYRPQKEECEPDQTCAVPENRRRQRILLWIAATMALLLLTFPYYIGWIL
jgi:mercuric ion transport protein